MNWIKQPIVQLSTSSILFGLGAIFVVFIDLDATVIAFYRLLIAALLFGVYLLVKREQLRIAPKALLFASLAGVFLGIDLAMWNTSIGIVGPGIATILNSLQVFFMAMFGIAFYREKPTAKLWLSLFISFIGVVLLCSHEIRATDGGWRGVIIGVVSGAAFAASMLCLKKTSQYQQRSAANTVFYTSLAGALATGVYAALDGASFTIPTLQSWVMILIYGGIVHVFSWFLMVNSISHIAVAVVGLIMCLEPVVVFFIDVGFLGKNMFIWQYMGAAMTIAAIYLGSQLSKSS